MVHSNGNVMLNGICKMNNFFKEYRYEDFSVAQWVLLVLILFAYLPLSVLLAVSFLLYRLFGWNRQYYGVEARINSFSVWYFDDFLDLPIRY